MKNYFKFESKLFLKERKNQLLAYFFIIFLLLLYLFIRFQGLGNMEEESYENFQFARLASNAINRSELEDENNQEIYELVLRQRQLFARTDMSQTVGRDDWYYQASMDLADMQLEMLNHDLTQIDMNPNLLPTENEARSNRAFFEKLLEDELSLITNKQNGSGFLMSIYEYLGIGAFAFILLATSSILTTEKDHLSLINGFPINFTKRLFVKWTILLLGLLITTFLFVSLGTTLVTLLDGPGNFNYPIPYYSSGEYQVLSVIKYGGVFFLYYFFLVAHVIVLATLLNLLLKNEYATIFAGGFLFVVPYLFEEFILSQPWIPMNYYLIEYVLNGQIAYQTGVESVSVFYGIAVLFVWTILFGIMIFLYDYYQVGKRYAVATT